MRYSVDRYGQLSFSGPGMAMGSRKGRGTCVGLCPLVKHRNLVKGTSALGPSSILGPREYRSDVADLKTHYPRLLPSGTI